MVSNADVANTYRKLLDPRVRRKYTDSRLERMQYSMGLFVLYFGTRKQYPGIRHHTIILSATYEELLDDIFNKKRMSGEFSLYLHRPTATDPRMAPEGCDCFYALIPVPNQQSGIDWAVEGPRSSGAPSSSSTSATCRAFSTTSPPCGRSPRSTSRPP